MYFKILFRYFTFLLIFHAMNCDEFFFMNTNYHYYYYYPCRTIPLKIHEMPFSSVFRAKSLFLAHSATVFECVSLTHVPGLLAIIRNGRQKKRVKKHSAFSIGIEEEM